MQHAFAMMSSCAIPEVANIRWRARGSRRIARASFTALPRQARARQTIDFQVQFLRALNRLAVNRHSRGIAFEYIRQTLLPSRNIPERY